MRRPQFNIAGLMGMVVLAAIGLVALRTLPEWWLALCLNAVQPYAVLLVYLAVALNLAASAIAVAKKGPIRTTSAGYAAGGWTYLGLSLNVPWFTDFFTAILNHPRWRFLLNEAYRNYPIGSPAAYAHYRMVGHALCTIAAGLAGGLLARRLFRRNRADATKSASSQV
jgi:hypothetical protein